MLKTLLNLQLNFSDKPEYIVFGIIYGIVVLIILLSYIIYRFWLLKTQEKREAVLKEKAYDKAVSIIQDASKRSYDIITDANTNAQKILANANVYSTNSQTTLEEEVTRLSESDIATLNKLSQDLLNTYKGIVNKEKEQSFETIQTLSQGIKTEILSEIDQFKDNLKKETFEAQDVAKAKIEEEYQKVEKELQDYKQAKMAAINKYIYEIISTVSKDVLGKSVNIEENEDLIMKSLEEGRRNADFKL